MSRFPTLHDAVQFAARYHNGQDRKYTDIPYLVHPLRVMQLVRSVSDDEALLCAAVLHDVVEDTDASNTDVREVFGQRIADLVGWLTDVSVPGDGNREMRKRIDREHIANAPPEAKTVKLADLIDNTRSITQHDQNFAHVYMQEKATLLPVLRDGDARLWALANELVQAYFESTARAR